MTVLVGLACAGGAAIAFGVQYVPVKKYEIYDGTTFQWFMCNGILFVGIATAMALQQFEDGCPLEVVFGGVLWGISNYLVLPLVKLLGIGLGFSMYHFVNLCVGYSTGRFGFFGVPRVEEVFEGSLFICDAGCVMILLSFIAMIFVEQDHSTVRQAAVENRLPPPIVEGIDLEYREMYHRWRQGECRGSQDARVGMIERFERTSIATGGHCFSNGGFGMYGSPSSVLGAELVQKLMNPRDTGINSIDSNAGRSSSSTSPSRISSDPGLALVPELRLDAGASPRIGHVAVAKPNPCFAKAIGVALALAGGGTCGVQSVPATLYQNAHPGASVVFPQCIGIWIASTMIYLCYSAVAWFAGWKVPHSTIRPAFFSGCIWAIGFALMISGIKELGYSVGYTLDAVGPILVSSLFSIFVFKEITDRKQLTIYAAAELLQLVGVVLIAAFGKQS